MCVYKGMASWWATVGDMTFNLWNDTPSRWTCFHIHSMHYSIEFPQNIECICLIPLFCSVCFEKISIESFSIVNHLEGFDYLFRALWAIMDHAEEQHNTTMQRIQNKSTRFTSCFAIFYMFLVFIIKAMQPEINKLVLLRWVDQKSLEEGLNVYYAVLFSTHILCVLSKQ